MYDSGLHENFARFPAWTMAASPPGQSSSTCQNYYVSASDGYANVRSSPQINANNIEEVLLSGHRVKPKDRSGRWWPIESPAGWLAQSQVSYVSCEEGQRLLWQVGIPAIKRLGREARNGDRLTH